MPKCYSDRRLPPFALVQEGQAWLQAVSSPAPAFASARPIERHGAALLPQSALSTPSLATESVAARPGSDPMDATATTTQIARRERLERIRFASSLPAHPAIGAARLSRRHVLDAPEISTEPIKAQLMLLPIQRGEARLVWNFQAWTLDEQHALFALAYTVQFRMPAKVDVLKIERIIEGHLFFSNPAIISRAFSTTSRSLLKSSSSSASSKLTQRDSSTS